MSSITNFAIFVFYIVALRAAAVAFPFQFRFFMNRIHDEPPKREHQHQRRQDGELHEEAEEEEGSGEDGDAQLWETRGGRVRTGEGYDGLDAIDSFCTRLSNGKVRFRGSAGRRVVRTHWLRN